MKRPNETLHALLLISLLNMLFIALAATVVVGQHLRAQDHRAKVLAAAVLSQQGVISQLRSVQLSQGDLQLAQSKTVGLLVGAQQHQTNIVMQLARNDGYNVYFAKSPAIKRHKARDLATRFAAPGEVRKQR